MQVRAKFTCVDKKKVSTDENSGFSILMQPVTCGSKENEEFFNYTPYGRVEIGTINPVAAEQFEIGKEYYVDFTKVEEEKLDEQGN